MGHGDTGGLWIPEHTWMKDDMLRILVTSCGTGRISSLSHYRNEQTTVAQPADL